VRQGGDDGSGPPRGPPLVTGITRKIVEHESLLPKKGNNALL
jgi:hypothetical protein